MFDNLPMEDVTHAQEIVDTIPSQTVLPLANWAAGVMRLPEPYDTLYFAHLRDLHDTGHSDEEILDQVLSDLQARGIRVADPEICLELAYLANPCDGVRH